MRAIILAAGLGERMGVMTQATPKPLLLLHGHHLIEYAIFNLKRAGIVDLIINIFYHGAQIKAALGNGKRYGVNIIYSEEKERLEVGGGLVQALPLLGKDPFVVISSDVITDFPLATLPKEPQGLAHLVLVDNPPFHPQGDFGLRDGYVDIHACSRLNYSGIGVYRPELFAGIPYGFKRFSDILLPWLQQDKQVTGEYYQGIWYNIGTPKDLELANHAREHAHLRQLVFI